MRGAVRRGVPHDEMLSVTPDVHDAASLARALDFVARRVSSVQFADLSLLNTYEIAESLDAINASSEVGRVCVRAARGPQTNLWHGRQEEFQLPWYSVVSGGGVSQN
jgi:2-phospho-L-lactate guanylyltransferase (CobY/MobA/RfbA family)